MAMGSSCTQLCLRARSLLCSSTASSAHLRHCTSVTGAAATTRNGRSLLLLLLLRRDGRNTGMRRVWRQHVLRYSDFASKHLASEAGEGKSTEARLGTAVVEHRSPLLPLGNDERHMPFDLDAVGEFSALDEIGDQEALGIAVPVALPPWSVSLSDYVDKSETLSKLVQLGVDLWKLEQRPNVGSMLLRLDFDADVAPRLLFLKRIGVEDSRLAYIVSHNPFILTESLESLEARVEFLKSKKFSQETVASMVSRAPYLLNFSVTRLDNRLGFFQEHLKLSSSNTRNILARLPRLLCSSLEPVKENLKVLEIELGFKQNEIQHIVLAVPKVLTANKKRLTQTFDLLYNTLKVPHHLITKFPQVLNSNYLRIKERSMFLKYLGKDQYDPNLPNYVPLDRLVHLPTDTFCTEVASATLEDFTLFQKTL